MDVSTAITLVFVALAIWALASIAFPAKPPEPAPPAPPAPPVPVTVELGTLAMKTEIAMSAVENTLRSRSLHHEAEGARQVRAAVNGLLEAMKNEQV